MMAASVIGGNKLNMDCFIVRSPQRTSQPNPIVPVLSEHRFLRQSVYAISSKTVSRARTGTVVDPRPTDRLAPLQSGRRAGCLMDDVSASQTQLGLAADRPFGPLLRYGPATRICDRRSLSVQQRELDPASACGSTKKEKAYGESPADLTQNAARRRYRDARCSCCVGKIRRHAGQGYGKIDDSVSRPWLRLLRCLGESRETIGISSDD